MKKILFLVPLLFSLILLNAQPGIGFRKGYVFLQSGNVVSDKNFYLLTVIQHEPEVKNIIKKNEILQKILIGKLTSLKQSIIDSCISTECLLGNFKFDRNDSLQTVLAFTDLYNHYPGILNGMINHHLRPSGYYERFSKLSNRDLLINAWKQFIMGVNNIIDQFGLGKKMRYPRIDSASYDTNGDYYKGVLKNMLEYVGEQSISSDLFYQPSQRVALQLMDVNDRDEPARLEPLELHENQQAFNQVRHTNWKVFKYACIEVPGSGPDVYTTPISPICKIRCALAALRFRDGWAPFIIVSGGYAHPFHTPYCEAVEMKKYLMQKFSIPASAIIIEPQARHTTTNLRNVNRLIFRYGIPGDKPSVFVSTKSQVDWVMDQLPNQNFDKRCMMELGYLPYRDKKRISSQDMLFYPTLESLQMDPYDPLDP